MKRLFKYILITSILSSPVFTTATNAFYQTEEEVVFDSYEKGTKLSGTLTLPEKEIKSAVVILSVAGPTDRDGTLGIHKFYKTLAHHLAENGIASIRFDSRGIGQSEGDLLTTSLEERAQDACNALDFLNTHKELVEVNKGFVGISEGGAIGLTASSLCKEVNFGVMLSTPIQKGLEVLNYQADFMLSVSPLPEETKTAIKKEITELLSLVSDEQPATNKKRISEILSGPYGKSILPPYAFVPRDAEAQADFMLSEWYQSQINYNIQPSFKKVNLPILGIYGSLDRVINPKTNAELLQNLYPTAEVNYLESKNHLMQTAKTGLPMEYAVLPESISKDVLEMVSNWILTQIEN